MKKLASTLPNMILSLGCISVFAGAVLGGVYTVTKEPIERQAAAMRQAAISDVAPAFTNNPEADKWETEIDGLPFTVYPALENGRLAGAAVKGSSMDGFAGEITVMCGFEADGTLKDYRVLTQAETPGLGSKMEEWFRNPRGGRSVLGKDPSAKGFKVAKDGGEIDGITAATISSRAFISIVRNASEAFMEYKKQHNR